MSWWETVVDSVPVVGATYRTVNAITAHVTGDHERAQEEWANAGINIAGDALGLVTGGAGKVATVAARTGARVAVNIATKQGVKAASKQVLKQAVKQGSRAATRSARKQLTKKGMKKYAKKYVKKKVKKAVKKAKEGACSDDYDEYEYEYEESVLEDLHRFSGHWRGFYKQFGTNYEVECMLIIDQDGNMAGKGCDTVSNYKIDGRIDENGDFQFNKQYTGPTATHCVIYRGTLEWETRPVLQGQWSIPPSQQDDFVLIPEAVGLEAAVISLSCLSAEDVLCMSDDERRQEVIEALEEILEDVSADDLSDQSDEQLIQLAEALTLAENDEYDDSDEEY